MAIINIYAELGAISGRRFFRSRLLNPQTGHVTEDLSIGNTHFLTCGSNYIPDKRKLPSQKATTTGMTHAKFEALYEDMLKRIYLG